MTGTEVATVQGSGTLALRGDQADWTEMQQAALAQIGVADAPRGDQLVLLHVSQRTGLDPFARQIYMIGRNDKDAPGGKKWTIQTGIEGFRVVSERHPQYGGTTDPDVEWCGEDGAWRDVWLDETKPPVAARFGIIRKDRPNPIRGVARYKEYVQTKYSGEPNSMWTKMDAHMLGKCAEALARRKAFPQDLGNVYTDDEMAHVDNPPPVVIQAERVQTATDPDWDGLITTAEAARDVDELGKVWKLARGIRPNDTALLDRIAQAAERVKAASAEPEPAPAATEEAPPAAPDRQKQMRRLFALLRDGGIGTTPPERVKRLLVTRRLLNRPGPLGSFDDLTDDEITTVVDFLQRHQDDGDLTHTLAEMGKPAADDTPAQQPEQPDTAEGDQQ